MSVEDALENQHERQEIIMKNTTDFREALDKGQLEEAEKFLNEVFLNPDQSPQYDKRWLDHRQRELFQSFYKKEDWRGAKRIVEKTEDERGREGRKNRLEELSGMDYKDI